MRNERFSSFLVAMLDDAPMILASAISIVGVMMLMGISSVILDYPYRSFMFAGGDGVVRTHSGANPRYTDKKVLRFARKAVSQCFSVDIESAVAIIDGDEDNRFMNCLDSYFADLASLTVRKVYPDDNLLSIIKTAQAPVFAVVPMEPVIVGRERIGDDRTFWVVTMPVTTTIQSLSASDSASFMVDLTILPDPGALNPSSLIIGHVKFH